MELLNGVLVDRTVHKDAPDYRGVRFPLVRKIGLLSLLLSLGLLGAADSTEALLELVDPSFGIDELLLTREEGMRVGSDPDRDDIVINSVHLLHPIRLGGGLRDVLLPGAHVLEDDGVVFGVEILFHGNARFAGGGGCVIWARCQDFEPVSRSL